MAKTAEPETETRSDTLPEDFENVIFDTFVPEQVSGKYDRHVQAMIAKDEELEKSEPKEFKQGKRTRVAIVAPADDAEKTVRQFQDSARKFGKTGRHVGTEPQGDGGVLLRFVLGVRQSRPRKPKEETATDVPQEVTPESQAATQEDGADQGDAA